VKKLFAFIICFFYLTSLFSQSDSVFILKSLVDPNANTDKESGIKIDRYWKYHKGDDMKWAEPELDTKDWSYVNPLLALSDLPEGTFEKTGWFRLRIEIDTLIVNTTLALLMNQHGASEIYVDGTLVKSFGYISSDDLKKDHTL